LARGTAHGRRVAEGPADGVEIYLHPDYVPPAYQRFVWKRVGKIEYRRTVVVYWTLVRPRRR
jgi:hypothetical protein